MFCQKAKYIWYFTKTKKVMRQKKLTLSIQQNIVLYIVVEALFIGSHLSANQKSNNSHWHRNILFINFWYVSSDCLMSNCFWKLNLDIGNANNVFFWVFSETETNIFVLFVIFRISYCCCGSELTLSFS